MECIIAEFYRFKSFSSHVISHAVGMRCCPPIDREKIRELQHILKELIHICLRDVNLHFIYYCHSKRLNIQIVLYTYVYTYREMCLE